MRKRFSSALALIAGFMLVGAFALGFAGCGDAGGNEEGSGFTITGYPGPANQQLYANTNGNVIDGPTLVLSSSGIGNINADGTVSWVSPGINGPNGTFWLYIFMADSSLMRSNTQIAMSSGQAAYSEFTPIADEREDLEGELTVNPSIGVITGTELTANYDGSETINTWQWGKINIDGFTFTVVGTNSKTFTPLEAGLYTVTISAAGYRSKTSAPVSVSNPPGGTPSAGLIGRWGDAHNEQLHIRIYEDGTGYLSGWRNSTPVSIDGNTLTIESAGLSASATLSINAGKLTLSNRTGIMAPSLQFYEILSPFDRLSSFGRVISAERIAGTWESPTAQPWIVLVYEFNDDLTGVRYTEEYGLRVGSIPFTYTIDIESNGIWTDFDDKPEWHFLWVWAEEDLLLEDIDIEFTRRSGGDDGGDL